jgi:hypothetical protein
LSKAQAVQAQIETLKAWINELNENFHNDLDRIIPFDYSSNLAAAMDLHGIGDPHTAWSIFNRRVEMLLDIYAQL